MDLKLPRAPFKISVTRRQLMEIFNLHTFEGGPFPFIEKSAYDDILHQVGQMPFDEATKYRRLCAEVLVDRDRALAVLFDLVNEWEARRLYAPTDKLDILKRALALLPPESVKLNPNDKRGKGDAGR